jgi:hypothetical protein
MIIKDVKIVFRYSIGKIKWILQGKPMIEYTGYNCGCCGKWVEEKFKVPTYQSWGEWYDTWGLCKECCSEDNNTESS